MNLNLVAISIGNTRTRVGLFIDSKLAHSHAMPNHRLEAELTPMLGHIKEHLHDQGEYAILLASVNPANTDRVAALVQSQLGKTVRRVERDLPIPVGRQLDPEAIVGEDRLLNAAAAYEVLKQACVVVDAGTAITVDFIDGAGTFHGGAIAPGAQLMLSSLHEHTAQLPEITFARPQEPVGHNTQEAMLTAVFHGIRGMVRELVEQYAQVAGSFPVVIATGGNAQELLGDFEMVDRVVPDLTLMGLLTTYKFTMTQQAEDTDDTEDTEDEA